MKPVCWWRVWSYLVYESADSAWSLIVVSVYFGAFVQYALGEPEADFGWALTAGNVIVALLSPLLGASADVSGRRQPYLRVFVFAAAAFTAGIEFAPSFAIAVLLFTVAYVCVNAAFTFYTALLPAVANECNVSTVVGIAVGSGYAGGLATLALLSPLAPTDAEAGRVFVPMALIYLLLAFPAMYLAPDFEARRAPALALRQAYARIAQSLGQARRHRDLYKFLIADFLYENAAAAVITLMGLYARNVVGFAAAELTALFIPGIVMAAAGALLIFGPLTRRWGPKRAILLDLAFWLALFAAVLVIQDKRLFAYVAGPLAGLGLAGVWTASRVMLTALTPVEKSGEFWGLYNLSGRTASILGTLTWTAALTVVGESAAGYHAAVLAMAVYVLLGAAIVFTLPDVRPTSANVLVR
ncbi:MAG: MFS transporter [Gammaproteobacteria bacterium]|nr:MFS transporter [Gammaproteobacteria bacterium]